MDSNQLLMALVTAAVTIIGVLTKFVVTLLQAKIAEIAARTENDSLKRYIQASSDAVEKAVRMTAQTYVSELQKSGNFNKQAHKKAFEMAKETASMMITADMVKAIEKVNNDFPTWLTAQIEYYVAQQKKTD